MAAHPSPRLVASRGLLQREFNRYQAAAGEQISYGSAIARWLAAQLPGADPGQLGWGILAVTALLCPDSAPILRPAIPRRKSSERRGERTSMILASRVGEALVESAGAPGGHAMSWRSGRNSRCLTCPVPTPSSPGSGPPPQPRRTLAASSSGSWRTGWVRSAGA
jgi:hypothetical protein